MHALKVLEFDAIRARLAENCETSLGAADAVALEPSFDAEEVWSLLELTEEAFKLIEVSGPPSLGAVRDLRDPLNRAARGGTLGGQELYQIADALMAMRAFKGALSGKRAELPLLWEDVQIFVEVKHVEDALYRSLEANGDVKDSASEALASIRHQKVRTHGRLQERINSYTSGKYRELLSDPIVTVRDGRYVVPLKAEYRGRIKGIVHDTSSSGQTIFVEPEDVLQLGNALRELDAAERDEVGRILAELSGIVGEVAPEAIVGVEAAGRVDLALSKARLGLSMRGNLPEKLSWPRIEVEGGRHPLLDPETVVPLDLAVGKGHNVLITGPNTGGKTVAIKAIGLFVLMAQAGLMPPADRMRLGAFKQVWADIGDEQSLQQSLSTFGGHIKNISTALKGLQEGALVLLDEVGAGTDPAEGASLARAILTEIVDHGGTVLASTHYGELKAFAFETEGFQNAAMEFDTKTLRPTFRLLAGAAGASQALRIAERYGIPKHVVERAREGLSTLHQDVTRMFESLDEAQKQARRSQGEADKLLNEARQKERQAERKLAEADEIRRTAHAKAQTAVEEALREIRQQASEIFEELKKSVDPKAQAMAREQLKALQESGAALSESLRPADRKTEAEEQLKKGASVRIEGYSQAGTLLEDPAGGNAIVRVGPLKMTVPVSRLRFSSPPKDERRPPVNVRLQRAMHATTEIHLRAMRAEEAERDLEKFIDDAVLAGFPSIRIVHGKGEGVLRKVTQSHLKKNPNVSSFRDGDASEGGQGVTIAVLK